MSRLLEKTGEELVFGSEFLPTIPRAKAFLTSNFNTPTSGITTIALTSESYDTEGMHDPAVNNSRITIKTAGLYRVKAQLDVQAGAGGGMRNLGVIKNGIQIAFDRSYINSGSAGVLEADVVADCAVNDYFEMNFSSNAGVSDALTLGEAVTFLEVVYQGQTWAPIRRAPVVQRLTPAQFAALSPASFVNGDIVDLDVGTGYGATNPVTWRFAYNAGSSSAYKWEFVGGPPLCALSLGNATVGAANTWINVVSAYLVMPRSGEYVVDAGAKIATAGAAPVNVYTTLVMNGTPAGLQPTDSQQTGWWVSQMIPPCVLTIPASGTLGVSGQSNNIGCVWSNIGWSALPLRISNA
jgi:hypothetical protein